MLFVPVALSGFMSARPAGFDVLVHGFHNKREPEQRAVDDEKDNHEDDSVAAEGLFVDIPRSGAA